jgi:hypothetical protein
MRGSTSVKARAANEFQKRLLQFLLRVISENQVALD